MQMLHAEGEVLGEVVDVGGVDGGAGEGGVRIGEGAVGGGEVFGEVVEDRGEAVVFVEAWQGAGGEVEGFVDAGGEFCEDHGCLLTHGHVCFALFDEHCPVLYKLGDSCPWDFEPAFGIEVAEAWSGR